MANTGAPTTTPTCLSTHVHSGGSGGSDEGPGGFATYLGTPHTILAASSLGGQSNNNTWVTYNIPSSIPSTAGGIIIRVGATSDEAQVHIYARTSAWGERKVAHAHGPNNSDDASGDYNTFVIPYSSTIQIKYYAHGTSAGNAEEQAHVYVDGYIGHTTEVRGFGERSVKSFNTVYYSPTDAIVTAEHTYVSSWPNMIAYADTSNPPTTERLGHNSNDSGGGQVAMTFIVKAGEYWKVSIDGNYTDQEIVYTPMSSHAGTVDIQSYDTGWVSTDGTTSVGNGATLTFDHSLGTNAFAFTVYAATDSSGSNSVHVPLHPLGGGVSSSVTHGAQIQDITNSQFTLQLGTNGYVKLETDGSMNASSSYYNVTFQYIRVIAIRGGTGSSGLLTKQTYSGGSSPNGDNGIFCGIPPHVNEVNIMVNSVSFDGNTNSMLGLKLGTSAGLENSDYCFTAYYHAPYSSASPHYPTHWCCTDVAQKFFPLTSCIANIDTEEGGTHAGYCAGLIGVARLYRTDGNCWTMESQIGHSYMSWNSVGWTALNGKLDRIEIKGMLGSSCWCLGAGTVNISYR